MADPAARSALAPQVRPIRVEIEDGGRLQTGSVCHFRLQADNRVLDYRTRVREILPNQRIVLVSDSAVSFEVVLETRPQDGGTRLTHTERFEPKEEMLRLALTPTPADTIMEEICRWLPLVDPEYAARVRSGREEMLEQKLGENLDQWLDAIKQHLEDTRPA